MPLEAYLAQTALSVAVSKVERHREAAQNKQNSRVDRCVSWIHAAHAAVVGLQEEYAEIIQDSINFDLRQPEKREMLLIRIDTYLRTDRVRPLLMQAVGGLEEAKLALQKNPPKLLGRLPFRHPDESHPQTLASLSDHLDGLVAFLRQLSGDLDHLSHRQLSGVGLEGLVSLEQEISQLAAFSAG